MDFAILDFIQNYFTNGIMDFIMKFVTRLGDGGLLWIIVAVVLLCFKKTRKVGIFVAVSLILTAIIGNVILKNIFQRVRPFIEANHTIIINPPGGFSFPSGHTSSSFAAAAALGIGYKKYAPYFYVLAVLIGFSRLYLYVHYPSDVLVGAILGIGIALICKKLIYNKIENVKIVQTAKMREYQHKHCSKHR